MAFKFKAKWRLRQPLRCQKILYYNSKEKALEDALATERVYKCPLCRKFHLENIAKFK